MSGLLTLVLWLVGVGLLAVELFVPSLVVGVLGVLALVGSVVLTWSEYGPLAGLGLGAGSVGAAYAVLRLAGSRLALRAPPAAPAGAADDHSALVGQRWAAATVLRPGGFATIGGRRVDVVTQGEHLEAGTPVEVMAVEGSRVVVRRASPAA